MAIDPLTLLAGAAIFQVAVKKDGDETQPVQIIVMPQPPQAPVKAEEKEEPPSIYEIPLTSARSTWTELTDVSPGDFIHAYTDGTLDGVLLKLGMRPEDKDKDFSTYRLRYENKIHRNFKYVWLQNPALSGVTLYLHVGRKGSAEATFDTEKPDSPITTPTSYNTTLTTANTEYSQALPSNCRYFEWQCRTEADVRYAFATGKVAGPTAAYHTLKAGDYYFSPQIAQGAAPSTLYWASATAAVVVELLAWV